MADTNQNEEAMTKAAYAYEAKYPRKEWPARRHGFAEGARWRAALAAPEPQDVERLIAASRGMVRLRHVIIPQSVAHTQAHARLVGEAWVAFEAALAALDAQPVEVPDAE